MTPDRCEDCGQFAGEDHECATGEPETCRRTGCEQPLPPPNKAYCSSDCRDAHRKERAREAEKSRAHPCKGPGCDDLTTNDSFCSPECQWAGNAERQRPKERKECAAPDCSELHENERFCSTECIWEGNREQGVKVDDRLSQENYVIADGHLIFTINGKLVRIKEDRWERICRDYSKYGGDLTQAETARKHGIPLPWMRKALAAYKHYKASPPMSRERIARAEDLEPLVAEAVENKEYQLLQKIERREDRKIRREWREMKQRLQQEERHTEAAARVAENLPELQSPPLRLQETARWGHAMAPTTDEHIGLPVWGEGSWDHDYDTDIGAQRLVAQGQEGASWLASQGGAEVVHRVYMGDFFNSLTGETAHGTPMDQDTRYERVWDMALRAVLENAQAWRQACETLRIYWIPGNHDSQDTFKVASAIRFALSDEDDVEVVPTPKMYQRIRVAETLWVFDHGYRLAKLSGYKAKTQAETVARQVAGEDYHGAKHIVYAVGHKHDRAVSTSGAHLEMIRLPALCESSEYEHELRYAADPCADIFLLDEKGRIDTPKRLYRDVLDGAA